MSLEHKLCKNLANSTIHDFAKTKAQTNLWNTYVITDKSHKFVLYLPREPQPINRISSHMINN